MDALVNRPNRVPEMQRQLQAAPGFIHQKNPRGPLYLRAYMVLFSVGLAGSMYGMTNMARGVGKVQKGGS